MWTAPPTAEACTPGNAATVGGLLDVGSAAGFCPAGAGAPRMLNGESLRDVALIRA